LCKDSTANAVVENLFYGPARIAQAIKSLPAISIQTSMLMCDAIDISSFSVLPDIQAKKMQIVQLAFCGNAIVGGGQGEHYSFRRVFVVSMSQSGLSIRNDMMTLLPELGKNVALDAALAVNVSNAEEQIDRVVTATNIKRQHAREALQTCQGNVEAAVQMIVEARNSGKLNIGCFN